VQHPVSSRQFYGRCWVQSVSFRAKLQGCLRPQFLLLSRATLSIRGEFYNPSVSDHPILDWAAVLVPSATALYVAFAIYRRQERTRRYLARPLVAVQWGFQPNQGPFTRWVIELRNEAADAVNVESMTVVSRGEIIRWNAPLEPPTDYWRRVLDAAGILRIQQIEGNVIGPPRSIAGKAGIVLFDACVAGQLESITRAIEAVEIRLRCRSTAGETSATSHRYREVKPLRG